MKNNKNNYFNSIFYQSLIDSFQDKEKAELAAWQIAYDLGGQKVYIPHNIKESHRFAKYGKEACDFLSFNYGGETIAIPKGCLTNSKIIDNQAKELVRRNYSANTIAKQLNIHHRTAQKKQAKYRYQDQISLPL